MEGVEDAKGLVRTRDLWLYYNTACERFKERRTSGEKHDPYEYETVAFWEEIFHHDLLRGFTNNSQQPPNDSSTLRCDIVTRFSDERAQRRNLIFTEAKRANIAGEDKGITALEEQVRNYSNEYLKAEHSRDKVYACTIVGPYIRVFSVDKAVGKLVPLTFSDGGEIPSGYLNAASSEDEVQIRHVFGGIIQETSAEMSVDFRSRIAQANRPTADAPNFKSSPLQTASPYVAEEKDPSSQRSGSVGTDAMSLPRPGTASQRSSGSGASIVDASPDGQGRIRSNRSGSPRTPPQRQQDDYRGRTPLQYETPIRHRDR